MVARGSELRLLATLRRWAYHARPGSRMLVVSLDLPGAYRRLATLRERLGGQLETDWETGGTTLTLPNGTTFVSWQPDPPTVPAVCPAWYDETMHYLDARAATDTF